MFPISRDMTEDMNEIWRNSAFNPKSVLLILYIIE